MTQTCGAAKREHACMQERFDMAQVNKDEEKSRTNEERAAISESL